MATQKLALQLAYVQRAPEMDEQPYFSTTTTYIEAGATSSGPAAISALYFGDLSGLTMTSLTFKICRQDTYAAHVLKVSASTSYSSSGTSLGNFTFSNGAGTWTSLDLTNYISTIKSAPYIRLSHGSGSSWSSFYKTGANAPYLEAEVSGGSVGTGTKTVRIYPQVISGTDGYLNGVATDFSTGFMYAGKTGSSSNNDYISVNGFDLTDYRWKNIVSMNYTILNLNGGSSGGNSANLPAGVGVSKTLSYDTATAEIAAPTATATIVRSVGTSTTFDLIGDVDLFKQDGLTYVYLGSTSTANNTYKEFGGTDNSTESNKPYLEITYTENNLVWYNETACEVFYSSDGTSWVKCAPYYSENGAAWKECGI